MATKTGPDLTAAETAITNLMDDTCTIARNAGGVDDAVLDQNTGQLIDNSPGTRYTGRCMVSSPQGLVDRPDAEGGAYYSKSNYELSLPLAAMRTDPTAEPEVGDIVTVTSSRRDPSLVGREFRIIEVVHKTMSVSRKCALELRQ